MIQKIKNFLKRFLPPPVRAFNREIERILAAILSLRTDFIAKLDAHEKKEADRLEQLRVEQATLFDEMSRQLCDSQTEILDRIMTQLQSMQKELSEDLTKKVSAAQTELMGELSRQMKTAQIELTDELSRQMQSVQTELMGELSRQMKTAQIELTDELSRQMQSVQTELTGELSRQMQAAQAEITAELMKSSHNVNETQGQLLCELMGHKDQYTHTIIKLFDSQNQIQAELQKSEQRFNVLKDLQWKINGNAIDGARNSAEAVWAAVFNNVITDSKWLTNTSFSPGRWGAGYQALYVMYRVLNEVRPKRILELGLGQSTRMIAQYAATYENVEHIVIEHDSKWIEFFINDFHLSERTKILQLELDMISYKDAESVRVYKDIHESLIDKKFDFIFIDAPLGGDMKRYARIDVLQMIPSCLAHDFIVLMDDSDRIGEYNTISEMEKKLKELDIPFARGNYMGKKNCSLLCSERFSFVATM